MDQEEQLTRVLREWKVARPLPDRFEEQVWRRIASAEADSAKLRAGSHWQRLIEVLSYRPKIAVAYLLVSVFVGLGLGWIHRQAESEKVNAEMGERYVRLNL